MMTEFSTVEAARVEFARLRAIACARGMSRAAFKKNIEATFRSLAENEDPEAALAMEECFGRELATADLWVRAAYILAKPAIEKLPPITRSRGMGGSRR